MVVGIELDTTVSHDAQWRSLISAVRAVYSGTLTYGASATSCVGGPCHRGYRDVTWWDALDFAGVDAYFPLSNKSEQPTPSLQDLLNGWATWLPDLQSWQASINKPVLFLEMGYASYQGSTLDPGKAMSKVHNPVVDLQEQANAYQSTFETFYGRTWLRGIFWWRWLPDPNAGGSQDWTYTPQGKPALQVIMNWYSKNWDNPTTTSTSASASTSTQTPPGIPEFPIGSILLNVMVWFGALVLMMRNRDRWTK